MANKKQARGKKQAKNRQNKPVYVPLPKLLLWAATGIMVMWVVLHLPEPEPPVPLGNCTDSVQNQNESDVDCGGSCTPCTALQTCNADVDCKDPLLCSNGTCRLLYEETDLGCDSFLTAAETDRVNLVFVGIGYDKKSDLEQDIMRVLEPHPAEQELPGLFFYEPFASNTEKFNLWVVPELGELNDTQEPFCFALCDNALGESHCRMQNRYVVNLCNADCFLSYTPYEGMHISNAELLPFEFTHAFGHVFGYLEDGTEGVMGGINAETQEIPAFFSKEDVRKLQKRLDEYRDPAELGTTLRIIADNNFSMLHAEQFQPVIWEKRRIGADYGLRFTTGNVGYFMDFNKEKKFIVEDLLEGVTVLEEFAFPLPFLIIDLPLKASQLEDGWERVELYNGKTLPYKLVFLNQSREVVKEVSAAEVAGFFDE